MKDLIDRVAKMLTVDGVTVTDIYTMLKDEGMSDYDAYLTYIGGKMIYNSRQCGQIRVGAYPRDAVTVRHMPRVVP